MRVLRGESLLSYNTLALEARARELVHIHNNDQLVAACRRATERELPLIPLGEGSNVVLAGDLDAVVVRMKTGGVDILEDTADWATVRVAAGENWHDLVRWTLGEGLCGLENLALIPGTVGAAPIQNIGAYGVELQSVLVAVHALSISDGEPVMLAARDCGFAYRDSVFKHSLKDTLVITAVDLRLSRVPRVDTRYPALAAYFAEAGVSSPGPQEVFEAVVSIRRSKLPDPAKEPNAGSFFKNPQLEAGQASELARRFPDLPAYPQDDGRVKIPAAWLIDYCGWKGYREDGFGIHPEHALVMVNYGNTSGARLLSLACDVAANVAETFGVELVIEPRVYR